MVEKDKVPTEAPSKKKLLFWIGIPVAVLLISTAFVLGVYWASQQSVDEDVEVLTELDSEVLEDEVTKPEEEIDEPIELDVSIGEQALAINWLDIDAQEEMPVTEVLNDVLQEVATEWTTEEELENHSFKLGTVTGGTYDGFTLAEEYYVLLGMGEFYKTFYTLTDPTGTTPVVILDRYSSTFSFLRGPMKYASARDTLADAELEELGSSVRFDAGAIVAEFEQASVERDTQGRTLIYYGVTERYNHPEMFNYASYKPTATLENGRVLRLVDTDKDFADLYGLLFTVRADARLAMYELQIPFLPAASGTMVEPQVVWSNGSYNSGEYFKGVISGCGGGSPLNIVDKDDIGTMQEAGYYLDEKRIQRPIYEPVDWDTEYFAAGFERWKHRVGEDATMEEFALSHPYFYYQDVLGRWIEFTSADAMTLAECGKPVIYLYPETEMDIDVTLEPVGGFTVTEPTYDNGWRVTASPDGTLVNRDDGEEYPYLFWEGHGGSYSAPKYYWVVEKDEVEKFLVEHLFEFGFETNEIVDFMDFWYPRMQDAPWYKIGFHGTNVMDELAPMKLSTSPNSVLRVLMDYEELDASIEANPPMIPKFERDGFSVVEWGGVIK